VTSTLHQLLVEALPWLHRYGYLALVIAVGVEGFGIPAPGQTLLVGAALLSGRGEMDLEVVLLCALLASMAGDNLGYLIGRRGGRRLILRLGVNRHRLARVSRFYRRFGVWPVLASRFFDGARQLGGLVAGSAAMRWPRFFAADAAGALLWVGVWGLGVYQFERHAGRLHAIWAQINPVAIAVAVGAVAAIAVWLWRTRRRQGP
jgi:membrane protein DedA with SNARE-associated domain